MPNNTNWDNFSTKGNKTIQAVRIIMVLVILFILAHVEDNIITTVMVIRLMCLSANCGKP